MIVRVVCRLMIGNGFIAVSLLLELATVAEGSAPRAFGAHRKQRQNPFQVVGVTLRAAGKGRATHERLEAMMTRATFVFVKRHIRSPLRAYLADFRSSARAPLSMLDIAWFPSWQAYSYICWSLFGIGIWPVQGRVH